MLKGRNITEQHMEADMASGMGFSGSLWKAEELVGYRPAIPTQKLPTVFNSAELHHTYGHHFLAALIFNKLVASNLIAPERAVFIFYKHK